MRVNISLATVVAILSIGVVDAISSHIYPAPCGRSVPSGYCSKEKSCIKAGGFFVGRDCDFYDAQDVGCCYGVED